MTALPNVEEMFDNARRCLDDAHRALGDAQDWLRPDWQPVGTPLTDAQAEHRTRMIREIAAAKEAINRARP